MNEGSVAQLWHIDPWDVSGRDIDNRGIFDYDVGDLMWSSARWMGRAAGTGDWTVTT